MSEKRELKLIIDGNEDDVRDFLNTLPNHIHLKNDREVHYFEEMNFEDFIQDYILDEIYEYEGQDVLMSELGLELCSEDYDNGSTFMNTETDRQFILNFWHEASETIHYLNCDCGISVNPFENPSTFAVDMIQKGINDALDRLPIVNEFQNAKVTLTEEVINEIENELSGDESNRYAIIQMIHQQEEEQQQ